MNQNAKSITVTTPTIPREIVAVAAYYDWLQAGQPAGRDQEFWLEAEVRLQKAAGAQPPQARQMVASAPATRPNGHGTPATVGLTAVVSPPRAKGQRRRKGPLSVAHAL